MVRVGATTLWLGFAACTAEDTPFEPDEGTTTTDETETSGPHESTGPTTSASGPDGSSSSGPGTTEGSDSSAGSSTGAPEPVVMCIEGSCQNSCTVVQELDFGEEGGVCECTSGVVGEDHVACELPIVCADGGYLCNMQALRYGIAGRFGVSFSLDFDGSGESEIEILGDGRARSLTYTQEHTCCSGASVDSTRVEGFPELVASIDDPIWQSCLMMIPDEVFEPFEIPECYRQSTFGVGACEGPLQACPEIAEHVPGCAAECPMANDGVCDEAIGTGLCVDGCDPVDCACPGNRAGVCDEISARDGTCPLGSDGDDCPG